MGIKIVWEDAAETVIRHIFDEQWTAEDYEQMNEQSNLLICEKPYPVCLITDLTLGSRIPGDALTKRKKIEQLVPPNMILNVIVTPYPAAAALIKVIVRTSQAITPKATANVTFEFATTLDAAYRIVEQHQRQVPVPTAVYASDWPISRW